MKRPHLFAVSCDPPDLAGLIEAARAAGHEVGWLDLDNETETPPSLATAHRAGVLRAVATTRWGSISVKRRAGAWVLDDLLREHFLGFRAVLVRGAAAADLVPTSLEPAGAGRWRLRSADGVVEIDAERFLRRLRKPPPRTAMK